MFWVSDRPPPEDLQQNAEAGVVLLLQVLRTPLLDLFPVAGIKITGCQSPSGEDTGTHPAYALLTPPSAANQPAPFGGTWIPPPNGWTEEMATLLALLPSPETERGGYREGIPGGFYPRKARCENLAVLKRKRAEPE